VRSAGYPDLRYETTARFAGAGAASYPVEPRTTVAAGAASYPVEPRTTVAAGAACYPAERRTTAAAASYPVEPRTTSRRTHGRSSRSADRIARVAGERFSV
jgi:hypothetical protein